MAEGLVALTPQECARVPKRAPEVDPMTVIRAAAGGSIIRVEATLRKLLESAQRLMVEAEITSSDQPRIELFGSLETYLATPVEKIAEARHG